MQEIKSMKLQIEIEETEYREFLSRYHFQQSDLAKIKTYADILAPLIECKAYYVWQDPNTIVFITLGDGIDRLQDLYEEKGALSESYILECLGLELLSKAYVTFIKQLQKETGRWAKRLEFLGDRYPLEKIKTYYALFREDETFAETIRYNKEYVLLPLKSVSIVIPMGDVEPTEDPCDLCSSCGNKNCMFRLKEREVPRLKYLEDLREKRKTGLQNMRNINSYAYQRFFGTV